MGSYSRRCAHCSKRQSPPCRCPCFVLCYMHPFCTLSPFFSSGFSPPFPPSSLVSAVPGPVFLFQNTNRCNTVQYSTGGQHGSKGAGSQDRCIKHTLQPHATQRRPGQNNAQPPGDGAGARQARATRKRGGSTRPGTGAGKSGQTGGGAQAQGARQARRRRGRAGGGGDKRAKARGRAAQRGAHANQRGRAARRRCC